MGVKRKRTYNKELKLNIIKLVMEGDKPVREISESMEIDKAVIYGWLRQYRQDRQEAFPGKGKQKPTDQEIRGLKKELADVKEERDILKKAIAIFSKKNVIDTHL